MFPLKNNKVSVQEESKSYLEGIKFQSYLERIKMVKVTLKE